MTVLQSNVSLKQKNTLALVASAEHFVEVTSEAELQQAIAIADREGWPITVLGAGSNVVLAGGVPGLVVHMAIKGIDTLGEDSGRVTVRIGAGENWHQFVQTALARGWYGLENLSLIPGTVGAAPVQNIGAYGVELSEYLVSVDVVDLATGESSTLDRNACKFGYRDSVFKGRLKNRVVIFAVTLSLPTVPCLKLDYPSLKQKLANYSPRDITPALVSETVCAIRSSKLPDPKVTPNVGSFFKNPVVTAHQAQQLHKQHAEMVVFPAEQAGHLKLAAGWLIEQAGWKGRVLGNVGVHPKQALVLVNRGGASGEELLALASRIQESVVEKFGVQLEIEPRIIP